MTSPRVRVAVLASGGGSNLQALIDHARALGEQRSTDIVLVASNRPEAGALARARAAGIPAMTMSSRFATQGQDLAPLLERYSIGLVVLAGYLQFVPPDVTRRFVGRLVNVHPAPLPEFGGPGMYGTRVHRAVLASGARMSGPTVHFVDDQYDHGAIIAHWPVSVLAADDAPALAARVLRAEHLLYPRVVQAVAGGEAVLRADGTVAPPFFRAPVPVFQSELDDLALGVTLDQSR